ncbi:Glycerophosphoryl diester phosphodiesterase [Ignavigranum ruoffiae]|uniref:Glycerophosphoryl diester phosphodiesterase n=1 Tax=Ignavigranum ruoffiae TaxID=89093 RepID=A0A1H9B4X5_9LACT|nr:glycerophosphodiester phosphodiesterase family protein [Ignavigranum ruoffiae]SEP83905.1 Glycerophosphoryl diester phosphodiesterase [Ignavigranum ruoffiae]
MSLENFCSHRGFNTIAPENSIPAFAAGIALGANEIEFDLWPTKDGRLLVCHDSTVNRTSNGYGKIQSLSSEEINSLDAGSYFSSYYRGLSFPYFEDVLNLFANKVIMNIHIKSINDPIGSFKIMKKRGKFLWNCYHNNILANLHEHEPQERIDVQVENRIVTAYDERVFAKVIEWIDYYNCHETVYITGEKDVLITAKKMAPNLKRCCLEGHMNFSIVENAIKYDCQRVQFCKHLTTQAMIDLAREHHLITNLFWSNDYDEAKHFFDLGIDVILTDNYWNTYRG